MKLSVVNARENGSQGIFFGCVSIVWGWLDGRNLNAVHTQRRLEVWRHGFILRTSYHFNHSHAPALLVTWK